MPYARILRPLLFRIDPERAHHLAFAALRAGLSTRAARSVARRRLAPRDPALAVEVLGLRFPTPIGLAAGFDKDALGFEALGAVGFGFVEVGTLTADPQPGNARPRLFRLPADQALLNRMGFNNAGAAAAAPRLRGPRETLVGVNIGKTKKVPAERAEQDYAKSARLLAPHADYLVVNVSSPNTPGLRDLQAVERLRPILEAVRAACPEPKPPLLVKIAPDLSDEDVRAVARLSLDLGLDGIIATNTSISREALVTPADEVVALGPGGISGAPVAARALEVLRLLRAEVGSALTLIAAGGVRTPEQAF
ncbi:MAG: quinone-dependent dihydroorotate dehydrogenase, partial [Deltaproteobacteria bacterium]|nr:quinone-dependent dihydroorotate dehydrogenase [Deltaproteobacteria bacterium]